VGAIAGKRKSWRPLPDVSSINAEQMLAADGEMIKRPKDRVGPTDGRMALEFPVAPAGTMQSKPFRN